MSQAFGVIAKSLLTDILAVQWLGLHISTAEGTGVDPGQGTRIPPVVWHGLKTKNLPTKTNQIFLQFFFSAGFNVSVFYI